MSKAVVFFADGTEECEALLVIDLLRRAKVEVTVASAMGRKSSAPSIAAIAVLLGVIVVLAIVLIASLIDTIASIFG